jgi:hypothetical protein
MEVGRWVRVNEDLGAYRWCRSARWIPRRTLVAPLSASSSFVDHVRELCWFKIHKQLKRKRGECKMTRFLESLRSFSHLQIRVNHKLDFPQHAISNSNPQVHQLSEPFSAFIDVTGQKRRVPRVRAIVRCRQKQWPPSLSTCPLVPPSAVRSSSSPRSASVVRIPASSPEAPSPVHPPREFRRGFRASASRVAGFSRDRAG